MWVQPAKKLNAFTLDTFIVHHSREQTLVSQGAPVWHHELACRKSWQCVRLDYRSRVAEALPNSRLLVKGNPWGIHFFTCWSEHMKYSDKLLTIRKISFCLPSMMTVWQNKNFLFLLNADLPMSKLNSQEISRQYLHVSQLEAQPMRHQN